MAEILEKQLCYDIAGLCFKVQNKLGRFCREIQYSDELESFLQEAKLEYQREYEVKEMFPDSPEGNRVDFMIKSRVIVDLKAKNFITKEDYFQMQRYLQSSGLEVGLIVNFRDSHLKPKRVLNIKLYSNHSVPDSDHSDVLVD